jgi:hypothetical protein
MAIVHQKKQKETLEDNGLGLGEVAEPEAN